MPRGSGAPANLARWISRLQRAEPISGPPGQFGSKTRQIYLERGRTVELIETITAHEPMRGFSGDLEGPGMKFALHVNFVDRGDRTLVAFRSEKRSMSFLMNLMRPFMRKAVRERRIGDLKRFKELFEAGELAG